ncbi:MAG: hypothetical protein Kow0079_14850 [Vicingaceae bacterium]
MKKMIFTLLTIVLIAHCSLLIAQTTQNAIWSLPPNYVKQTIFGTFVQNLPTTSGYYGGVSAHYSHNAIGDKNGNILFFVVDGKIYDNSGTLVDYVSVSQASVNYTGIDNLGYGDACTIVPNPYNCQEYYIFGVDYSNLQSLASDMYPVFLKYDVSIPTSSINNIPKYKFSNLFPSLTTNKGARISFAATDINVNGSRYVLYSDGRYINKFEITPSGLNFLGSITIPIADYSESFVGVELEIINYNNGYRLAVPFYKDINSNDQYESVYVVDLDQNLNVIPNTEKVFDYPYQVNTDKIIPAGLEFSPNGDYLYFSHTPSSMFPSSVDRIDLNTQTVVPLKNIIPSLLLVENDFSQSFIEMGLDGNLYLASINGLSIIQNPDLGGTGFIYNYIPLNNYQPYTLGVLPDQKYHRYTLPDQIDGMDYKAHFDVTLECCIATNTYQADNYTANTATEIWQPTALGGTNPFLITNPTEPVYVTGTLTIPSGANITIKDMIFRFDPNANVVVEAGAKLTLDNTVFTVDDRCDPNLMWKGVVVNGNGSLPQVPQTNQGYFVMKNNSMIEHALLAVRVRPGGIIQTANSTFRNNRNGVSMMPYQLNNYNLSKFITTTFKTEGLLNIPTLFPVFHAYLNRVKGINFYGCTFLDDPQGANIGGINNKGNGIISNDSRFSVVPYCSNPFNCNNSTPSEFKGLYYGIRAQSSNVHNTATVRQNNFINNHRAIYLSGMNSANVTENHIEVYKSKAPNDVTQTYGLYLNGCSGYTVQENDFQDYNDPNVSGQANSYGIIVNNSGENNNDIYKNYFNELQVGIQAQNINGGTVPGTIPPYNPVDVGLELKCNEFTAPVYVSDIALTSGLIDLLQGTCTYDPNFIYPSGNQFSYTQPGTAWDLFVDPSATQFHYNYHAVTNGYNVIPQTFTQPIPPIPGVHVFGCNGFVFDPQKSCPSKLNDLVLPKGGISLKIATFKTAIQNELNKIDGGNTQALLSAINSNMSNGNLKNLLMQSSPYLSDTVLIAYLQTNPPAGHIQQIINANGPVSEEVWNAFLVLNIKSKGIVNNLVNLQNSGVDSPRDELFAYIDALTHEKDYWVNNLLRYYINDTTGTGSIDSMIAILIDEGRKEELCHAYLFKQDITNADLVNSDIKSNNTSNSNTTDINDVLITVEQRSISQSKTAAEVIQQDSTLIQEIDRIAHDNTDILSCVKGESLLKEALDMNFNEPIEPININGSNLRTGVWNEPNTQTVNSNISWYPNPANESITITNNNNEQIQIVVMDYMGKTVLTSNINKTEHINIGSLASGVYILQIKNQENILSTDKLVVY